MNTKDLNAVMINQPVTTLEHALVSVLVLQPEKLPEVAGWLTPEMFYCPEAAFAYQAVLAQYERGEKPDLLTTETEMRRMDTARFEEGKGLEFLAGTMSEVRRMENVAAYAEEIHRRYMLRSLEALLTAQSRKATLPETDYLSLIGEIDQALLVLRQSGQRKESLISLGELASEIAGIHRENCEDPESKTAVFTGLNEFDEITGGLQKGELAILGGRPSDGKTSVAMQIAINAARAGTPVCFFSLEMGKMPTANRYFTGLAGVDPVKLRLSEFSERELSDLERIAEQWKDIPLYINYTPGNTVENIRSEVLLQRLRSKCDLVVMDYLQMARYVGGNGRENREQVVARQITMLKQLALEANCPVLVVSQMNRSSENRYEKSNRPVLSDLRDSGVIEQVADLVTFVYRPERHGVEQDPKTGESYKGIGLLIVAKNRNGATGEARFRFNASFTYLTNLEDGELPL